MNMEQKLLSLLQLFADGGDGGAGAAGAAAGTAEGGNASNADSSGRARLAAMGVPQDKLQDGTQGGKSATRLQEFLRTDPESNRELQGMFQDRTAKMAARANKAEQELAAIAPLAQKYRDENNLDPNLDLLSTFKHMSGAYADMAMQSGVSEEAAMEIDIKDRKAQQELFAQHFAAQQQQAAEIQKVVPNFDLIQAMDDETFYEHTRPENKHPLTVEQMFYALHGKEMLDTLMATTAQKTGDMITNAIASGSRRPVENGGNSQSPTNLKPIGYDHMSQEQRNAYKRARGLPVWD